MQVAITGASGLIGGALARSLRADGHTVRPLVRRPPTARTPIRWDPAAGTLDAGALEGVDAVVNLAGARIGDRRWSADRKRDAARQPHRRAPTCSPARWPGWRSRRRCSCRGRRWATTATRAATRS